METAGALAAGTLGYIHGNRRGALNAYGLYRYFRYKTLLKKKWQNGTNPKSIER